jgi:hypothetical protein
VQINHELAVKKYILCYQHENPHSSHVLALFNLAGCYLEGLGVEKRLEKAIELYKLSKYYADFIPGVPANILEKIDDILSKLS